jgi:two-component system, NarL family, response regulator NreC
VCPPAQTEQHNFSSARKIRCVLAHGHELLRQALRRLLEDEPDLEVVSEAANVTETVQTVSELRPEIVIMDTHTLGLSAGKAEEVLRRESPRSKVVFLDTDQHASGHDLQTKRDETAPAPASAKELVTMVRNACGHVGPEVYDIPDNGGEPAEKSEASPRKHGLTAREQEVVKLLAEGSTVRSAARVLGLSAKTVDAHKFNLMRKLGIHNKAELVMWAIREQVVKIPANF